MRTALIRRRSLLGAAVLLTVSGRAWAGIRPLPSATRRLKLVNAHTGETFDGPYSTGDGVIASAAEELSQLLRDHHSGVAVTMDMQVIDFLWDVLNAVGANAATILSAYRTPETNAMLARTTFGVAEHSQHIYARAIDFTISSSLSEAVTTARSMRRGGVGWYPRSHFIHIDSGPVRNWDLGEENLQQLLIHPEQELVGASAGGRARNAANGKPNPVVSQYAGSSARDELIRPSQYNSGSYGIGNRVTRPSQYGGTL
jgi:uncharacterized protein YcbK (DUF882 family)